MAKHVIVDIFGDEIEVTLNGWWEFTLKCIEGNEEKRTETTMALDDDSATKLIKALKRARRELRERPRNDDALS